MWRAPTRSWICSPGSWTRGPRCHDSPPSTWSRRWCATMLASCWSCSCMPQREGFAPRRWAPHSPPLPRPSPWTPPSPHTIGLARKALPCTRSLREPRVSPPLFLIGGLICLYGFQIVGSAAWCGLIGGFLIYSLVASLSFFMWIWWFFWVYGFDLLEILVEDRDFVCILSIGLLNVSYFSVWFERKSWFSGENVDDCLRKIYEVGWVCCYCEPNWLGLCVIVS